VSRTVMDSKAFKQHFPRTRKWIAVIVVIGLVMIMGLYVFRGILVAPYIQKIVQDLAESRLGGIRVTIGSIDGSYFRDLEIHDVVTVPPAPSGPLVGLSVGRLKVTYNVLSIFKGVNGFLADTTLNLEDARLDFDLSRHQENPSNQSGAISSPSFFLPEVLPRVRLQNMAIFLRGSGYETSLKGIDLQTRRSEEMSSTADLRIAQWTWHHPVLRDGKVEVTAEIYYSKEQISVRQIMVGRKEFAEFVKIDLKKLPEAIPFETRLHPVDGQLEIDGVMDHSGLRAGVLADNLDLERVSSFFRLPGLTLAGTLSMKAHVLLPQDHPSNLEGDLDLTLEGGSINGFETDRVAIRAKAKNEKLLIETLDVRSGANTIALRGVTAPAETIFQGDFSGLLRTATGEFSLDSHNVPSLLSLLGPDHAAKVATLPPHRLLIQGRVQEGTLVLSKGSLTTDGGYLRMGSCRIEIPAKNRSLMTSTVRASLKMDFPNLGLVSRIFALPAMGGSILGDVTIGGVIRAPKGKIKLTGRKIAFGGLTFDDLSVLATADSRRAVIKSMTLRRGQDRIEGEGTFRFSKQEFEDTRLKFRVSDLGPYVGRLWPKKGSNHHGSPGISGSMEGEAFFAGPMKMPHGTLSVNAGQIKFEGTPFGDATLRLRSDGRKISVETLVARHQADRIALSGSFVIESRSFENVHLQIDVADSARYTKNLLSETPSIGGTIHGNLDFSGTLRAANARADFVLGQLHIGRFTIPKVVFKARSSGRRIDIDEARINTLRAETVLKGNFVRGPADAFFDVEITQLTLSGKTDSLSLVPPGYVRFWRKGEISLRQVNLNGSAGTVRLDGTFSWVGKTDIHIFLSNVKSGKWFPSLVTDRLRFEGLNARVRLSGTKDAPVVTLMGELPHLESSDAGLSLAGRFDLFYGNQGISVRKFEWRRGNEQVLAIQGTLPVNLLRKPSLMPGPLSLDAKVDFSDLGALNLNFPKYLPRGGSFQGELHVAGTWNDPDGRLSFDCDNFHPPPHFKPLPPGPLHIKGKLSFDRTKLVIESIQGHSPSLSFSCDGSWNGVRVLPALLQGGTRKLEGKVNVRGEVTMGELGWVAAGVSSLRRVSGRLKAKIEIAGPASNPAINASVSLSEGELRPNIDVPLLDAVNLTATVTPEALHLQKLMGRLGGSAFTVTGSVMRKGESTPFADLRLQGKNLLYYRGEGVKVRSDTDLTVKGPLSRLEVAGKLAITDGYFSRYFDLLSSLKGAGPSRVGSGLQLFSIRRPPFDSMTFDVHITSKNPFKIRSNVVTAFLRPDLKLGGTGEVPILTGNVYVDSGRLILPSGNLSLETGVIRFNKNDPDRPVLDLTGKSRMFGYDITMVVQGPYDEPAVTLSSVPPLSNEELLLMVLTGRKPKAANNLGISERQGKNIAVYVGRDFISRWFASDRGGTDEPVLDRLNVVIGREVTRTGDETIEADFRLANGIFRKGDVLYLTGEKDAFDYYNAGLRIVFRFK